MSKQLKSNIALLTAAIVWGFAFSAQCSLDTDSMGEFAFNGIRYILGGIVLIPIIYLLEYEKRDFAKFKKTLIYGAITGVILFLASSIQMYALVLSRNAGKGGFLTSLYVVIVPFYNYILYKKKVKINEWVAVIIAIIGSYFLSITEKFGTISIADIILILSTLFWAAHIIAVDRFVYKVSPIKYSSVQFLVCGLCNLVFCIFCDKITIQGIRINLIPILYTGIMSTGVAYTCQVLGQKDANPNSASIILSLEGLFAAIGGMIFLNQTMSLRSIFGCVLMLSGAILSQLDFKGGRKGVTEGSDNTSKCS